MQYSQRKTVYDNLKKYDCINSSNSDDFIEVTEWTNGEGVDINMNVNGTDTHISLTHGQLEAINFLVKALDYNHNER